MNRDEMYLSLGVSDKVLQFGEAVLDELKPRFAGIEEIAELNQAKVIGAMQKNRVNATHFAASTGYGYDDEGRDNLERVYASAFHTEAALVRPQITCGTHALAIALSANLLPGDEMLAISGKPYDTLEEVIGLRESPCSLKEYGVSYAQVDLREDGSFDFPAIERALNDKTKLIHIQRSKGYCPRPTISVDAIGEAIAFCKKLRPDVVVMVDNCYGEFVEANEPSDFGADMIVGSLIKNPGGGLAPIGGYICGKGGGGSQRGVLREPDEPIIQQFRFLAFAGILGRVFIVRNSVPVKITLFSNFGSTNGLMSFSVPHEAFCQVLF